jgi:hypothetical protein
LWSSSAKTGSACQRRQPQLNTSGSRVLSTLGNHLPGVCVWVGGGVGGGRGCVWPVLLSPRPRYITARGPSQVLASPHRTQPTGQGRAAAAPAPAPAPALALAPHTQPPRLAPHLCLLNRTRMVPCCSSPCPSPPSSSGLRGSKCCTNSHGTLESLRGGGGEENGAGWQLHARACAVGTAAAAAGRRRAPDAQVGPRAVALQRHARRRAQPRQRLAGARLALHHAPLDRVVVALLLVLRRGRGVVGWGVGEGEVVGGNKEAAEGQGWPAGLQGRVAGAAAAWHRARPRTRTSRPASRAARGEAQRAPSAPYRPVPNPTCGPLGPFCPFCPLPPPSPSSPPPPPPPILPPVAWYSSSKAARCASLRARSAAASAASACAAPRIALRAAAVASSPSPSPPAGASAASGEAPVSSSCRVAGQAAAGPGHVPDGSSSRSSPRNSQRPAQQQPRVWPKHRPLAPQVPLAPGPWRLAPCRAAHP